MRYDILPIYALTGKSVKLEPYYIFCFFARRDDFGFARVVGQAGSLRPIVNRPNVANVQHSSFAACRYARRAKSAIHCRLGDPTSTHFRKTLTRIPRQTLPATILPKAIVKPACDVAPSRSLSALPNRRV
jgi:hypothetical protein